MDWTREVAGRLMELGHSGYWSSIESPLLMLWHIDGCTPCEIADKLLEFRKHGFAKNEG